MRTAKAASALLLAASVVVAAPVVALGPESERPSFRPLRFEEDWSAFDPATGDDFWDPIKHVDLTDDGRIWASLGGELRGRVEAWQDFGFVAGEDDEFLLGRARLHADVLGEVMRSVRFHRDGRVVTARLSEAMRTGTDAADSEDFVGLIRYAEGVKVAALLKESQGATKLSVRTRDGISAQRICLALGGGGHVAAAGARLELTLDEAEQRLLEQIDVEFGLHHDQA